MTVIEFPNKKRGSSHVPAFDDDVYFALIEPMIVGASNDGFEVSCYTTDIGDGVFLVWTGECLIYEVIFFRERGEYALIIHCTGDVQEFTDWRDLHTVFHDYYFTPKLKGSA